VGSWIIKRSRYQQSRYSPTTKSWVIQETLNTRKRVPRIKNFFANANLNDLLGIATHLYLESLV